jgi:predicted amidohydrolase YtcJ
MRRAERTILLRHVELHGRILDCRLADGVLAEWGVDLAPGSARVLDARGGALIPGLCDHHLHLHATAARADSIEAGEGESVAELDVPPGTGWLRIVGVHHELDRRELDRVFPDRPVRVQHRSGALWSLNSAAVELLGSGLTPVEATTGQVWRADDRLGVLLRAREAASTPNLARLGSTLAASGVTHVTDATPALARATVRALVRSVPQHVLPLGDPDGDGPVKIVVPDHKDYDYGGLLASVLAARKQERAVAIHAVTAPSLAMAIAAIDAVGVDPRDRIEHAASCNDEAAEQLARLGIAVVTQPTIFARHGATFRAATAAAERRELWRLASLRRAGVRIAMSSDAPYGDPDPWATLRAAATREPEPGEADERLSPAEGLLTLLSDPLDPTGPPRQLAVGSPADLCLLRVGLDHALRALTAADDWRPSILATFISGRPVHLAEGEQLVPFA